MKKFFKEFKDFAIRGSAIQMAVGVVIGGAFGKIVTSLTNDIITPLISLLTGAVNFTSLNWVIRTTSDGTQVILSYGNFIQSGIDFILTSFAVFSVIRALNQLSHKKDLEKSDSQPVPSEEVVVLQNILKELEKSNKSEQEA